MKYEIKNSSLVPGSFEAIGADGKNFVHNGKTVYDSKKGLMIALTRLGHSYPESEKAVPKVKEKVRVELDWSEDEVLALYEMAKASLPENPKTKQDFEKANEIAVKAGYGFFGSLVKHAKGILWSRETEEEKAGILQAQKEFKENTWTEEAREAANKVAKANGFHNTRAVTRACASEDDTVASTARIVLKLVRAAASQVMGKSEKVPEVQKAATTKDELLKAIETFKARVA